MSEQRSVTDIAAAPDEVWQVLTEVARWAEWMPRVKKAETTTPAGGLGAQYTLDHGSLGMVPPTTVEVSALDRPGSAEFLQRHGGSSTRAVYRLTPLNPAGTRVQASLVPEGVVGNVAATMFGGTYTKMLEEELAALKQRCEGN